MAMVVSNSEAAASSVEEGFEGVDPVVAAATTFQYEILRLRAMLEAAQDSENKAFKEVQRLQEKIRESILRLNEVRASAALRREEEAKANPPTEAQEEEGGQEAEEGEKEEAEVVEEGEEKKESQPTLADMEQWLQLYQADYDTAEQIWKERTLETCECRAMINDATRERNPNSPEEENYRYRGDNDGDYTLDTTKAVRITAGSPSAAATPSTSTGVVTTVTTTTTVHPSPKREPLIKAAYPTIDPKIAANLQNIPIADDQLHTLFAELDTSGNGFLSATELQQYFNQRADGLPLCENYVEKEMAKLNRGHRRNSQPSNEINFDEFCVLITKWASM